jgi:hypothetical protein
LIGIIFFLVKKYSPLALLALLASSTAVRPLITKPAGVNGIAPSESLFVVFPAFTTFCFIVLPLPGAIYPAPPFSPGGGSYALVGDLKVPPPGEFFPPASAPPPYNLITLNFLFIIFSSF